MRRCAIRSVTVIIRGIGLAIRGRPGVFAGVAFGVLAVDLADALKPMVTRYRPRLAERHLELDLPVDLPPVRADAVFLDQVVSNLLENEVKFVAPGGRVRVRAAAHDSTVRLSVDDTGPGVSADALPHLFEKFYRTGSGGRSARPGTGTGLAVVRGLTEAMGGSVWARTSGWRPVRRSAYSTAPLTQRSGRSYRPSRNNCALLRSFRQAVHSGCTLA